MIPSNRKAASFIKTNKEMGIKDLLRFMKPYVEPVDIKKYAAKRVREIDLMFHYFHQLTIESE